LCPWSLQSLVTWIGDQCNWSKMTILSYLHVLRIMIWLAVSQTSSLVLGCCFCELRFKLCMACTVVNSRKWSWLFEWVDNMPNIAGMLGQSQNVPPVKPRWGGFLLPRRRSWSLNRFGEYGVPRLLMIHGRTRFWTAVLDFCS